MFYSCTCPNCGYRYTPPSVPLNLDWTQWQDITWYDDHESIAVVVQRELSAAATLITG